MGTFNFPGTDGPFLLSIVIIMHTIAKAFEISNEPSSALMRVSFLLTFEIVNHDSDLPLMKAIHLPSDPGLCRVF